MAGLVLIKSGHDDPILMSEQFVLRPYRDEDEDAAVALWQRTWQEAYSSIDFAARLAWWQGRWRNELVPHAAIIVAEAAGHMVGFVTIDKDGYLDQLVVAPEHWGSQAATLLVGEVKRRAPNGVTLHVNRDNARAIRFYERNGFVQAGHGVNSISGRPVLKMQWKAMPPSRET